MASAKRVALVIGNSDYTDASVLPNAVNDAELIARTLGDIGYEVTLVKNLTVAGARRAVGRFRATARDSEVAIIYYAGHGIELSGENYLVPVDADVSHEDLTTADSIPLEMLQDAVSAASEYGILLVDACRDDPWMRTIRRISGTRSASKGLASIGDAPQNLLVSFATQPGSVAFDGQGENGPYAVALAEAIQVVPGLEIGRMFRRVGARVMELTANQQDPGVWDNLPNQDIYLNPTPPPPLVDDTPLAGDTSGNSGDGEGASEALNPIFRSSLRTSVSEVTECDRQAGYSWRPRVEGGHRAWDAIDPATALTACLHAIADYPNEKFFYFLAARALWKADETDPRIWEYVKRAAAADEALALDRMAHISFLGLAGQDEDRDESDRLARMAVEAGLPQALIYQGDRYRDNDPKDPVRAMALYEEADGLGLVEGKAKMAYLMMQDTTAPRDFAKVRALYQVAADAGFAWARGNIAHMDKKGQGIDAPDFEKALAGYIEACDMGNSWSCRQAGIVLTNEPYTRTEHYVRAEGYFKRACDTGDQNACFGLGWVHDNKRMPHSDLGLAKSLYETACDSDHGGACNNLANILNEEGDDDETLVEVVGLWEKSCGLKDKWACHSFARRLLDHSAIVRPDVSEAKAQEEGLATLRRACDLGRARSCTDLGNAYWSAEYGLEQDYQEASDIYLKGCDLGSPWSCTNRARLAVYGHAPIDEDPLKLLERACARDARSACRYLGEFTVDAAQEDGGLSGKAYDRALSAYEKACDLGDGRACGRLGWGLFPDETTKRTPGEYLALSLENGSDYALLNIDNYTDRVARQLQTALRKRGVYTGAIDGKLGPASERAMRALRDN